MDTRFILKALTSMVIDMSKTQQGFDCDYIQVNATKANVAAIHKIAAAAKYAGLHLEIKFLDHKQYGYKHNAFKFWLVANTESICDHPMTIYSIKHDLESCI